MADIFVDRILQVAGVLDKNNELITDDKVRKKLSEIYLEILDILKGYVDMKEEYYQLVAIWIIGAVNIEKTNTYPYLFINAMKGSGKTRLLKLITKLSGGDVLNSLTEAVLFRTKGTLGIDEFEGLGRKGNENLRELLNSAYKKGVKVKRMRKIHGIGGEQQVVEEFDVYRPIILANIWGMEDVLGDRCIKIVLDKSSNPVVTKKIERFGLDEQISNIQCRLCSVGCLFNVYRELEKAWNSYISNKYTYTTYIHYTTHITHTTNTKEDVVTKETMDNFLDFFNKVDESGLNGRTLELTFPLLFIANFLSEEDFEQLLTTFKEIEKERKEEDITESYDVSFIDFIAQMTSNKEFIPIRSLTQQFKDFIQIDKDWMTPEWVGRALKRLNLIKQKRRITRGVEIIPNIEKAQEKIKMFK